MNKYIYLIYLLLICTCSLCEYKSHRIIRNKDEIIPLLYNKTIGITSRLYHLETYNEHRLRNKYFFDRIEDKRGFYFVLQKDSIQFSPDNIVGVTPDGSEIYRQQICDYFKEMSQVMKHYHIHWSKDHSLFIPLSGIPIPGITIGLDNGKILEYRPGTYGDLDGYRKVKDEWYMRGSR